MKIHVSHLLTEQRFEAEDYLRKIQAGTPFEEVARKFSKCSSAQAGGDLGVIDTRRLDPDFADAALQLKPSELSAITRTKFGYHIIKRHA